MGLSRPHTGVQEPRTWLMSSRRCRQVRLRLSMVSRNAEEAKTRLLEKPGDLKAKELHKGKTRLLEKPGDPKAKELHKGKTRLQDYKTTRLQDYKAANHISDRAGFGLLCSEEAERRATMGMRTYLGSKREGDYMPAIGVSQG